MSMDINQEITNIDLDSRTCTINQEHDYQHWIGLQDLYYLVENEVKTKNIIKLINNDAAVATADINSQMD